MAEEKNSRTFVSAFARGLKLVQAFGPDSSRMTVADAATRTGLDRAVVRRLLLTLVSVGFARSDGRTFELTPNVLSLGYSFLSASGLDGRLQPLLDDLSRRVDETVSVTVLQEEDVVYIARSEAAGRHLSASTTVGSKIPALPNGSGRLLLSTLDERTIDTILAKANRHAFTARTKTDIAQLKREILHAGEKGYAIVDQEYEDGLISASVPLRSRAGNIVAALNVASHTGRMTIDELREQLVPTLQQYAAQMSALLI